MPGQVSNTHGSITTNGSEQVLFDSIAGADTPSNACFQFLMETHNMQAGDQITVRMYTEVVGDASSRVTYKQSVVGPAITDDMNKIGPAIIRTNGLKVTITRDLGTDRTYLWEVDSE